MRKLIVTLLLGVSLGFAQYKVEPAGPPPPDLDAAVAAALQKDGAKIVGPNGAVCEVWFRNTAPSGPKSETPNVALPTIPHGTFLGVIRFQTQGEDRRGQMLKPGLYTLRYSHYPTNGEHIGIAPQRDFAILAPAATDKDVSATPNYEELMNLSRKASGTPHPATLEMSSSSAGTVPSLEKSGEKDWFLHGKMGDLPFSILVVGRFEG
jgi:hypothetical protein